MVEQTRAEETLRDLVSRLGFGDGVTEPMADNDTRRPHLGRVAGGPGMIRRRTRRRPRRGEVPLRDWFSVRDPYRQVRTEVFLARLRAASRSVPADR